jgi:hypothetical protein
LFTSDAGRKLSFLLQTHLLFGGYIQRNEGASKIIKLSGDFIGEDKEESVSTSVFSTFNKIKKYFRYSGHKDLQILLGLLAPCSVIVVVMIFTQGALRNKRRKWLLFVR